MVHDLVVGKLCIDGGLSSQVGSIIESTEVAIEPKEGNVVACKQINRSEIR